MLKTRIIPCLQLLEDSLVKTVKFKKHGYIGDPINTVRIFNELEVDELCFLDIRATLKKASPNLQILQEIANECFMPLSYGGGIRNFEVAKDIFKVGIEKLVVNSYAHENPSFITKLSEHFGNQSIIGSIDAKKNFFGRYTVYAHDGTKKIKTPIVEWAQELEAKGAGELLVTSMDREGTWLGFDLELIKLVAQSVDIPVIANGGANNVPDMASAVDQGGASAVALGSMVVYQAKGLGVLVNFPDKNEIAQHIK